MPIDFPALFLRHQGRLGRSAFWIGFAILAAVGVIASLIPVVGQVSGLVLLWPAFCLLAQRLHDIGRGGGLAALAMIPAAISAVFGLLAGLAVMAPVTALALLPLLALVGVVTGLLGLVTLAFIIWAGIMPSQPVANAWGAPPS